MEGLDSLDAASSAKRGMISLLGGDCHISNMRKLYSVLLCLLREYSNMLTATLQRNLQKGVESKGITLAGRPTPPLLRVRDLG